MVEKPVLPNRESVTENPEAALRFLSTQFPDFSGQHDVRALTAGGDNLPYLVDSKWIFRFAMHPGASEKVESEILLLPHLQKVMPVPVPEISYAGLQPNGNYFFGYRVIEGEPLSREKLENLSLEDKERVVDAISRSCRALIDFPLELAREAKVRDMSMRKRHERILAEWHESPLCGTCAEEERRAIENVFVAYFSSGPDTGFSPALINTDLSCNHILMNSEGTEVAGIIDWSDVAIGDPHYLFPRLWIDLGEDTAIEIIRRVMPGADLQRIRFFVLARSLRSAVRDAKGGKNDSSIAHLARARELAVVLASR